MKRRAFLSLLGGAAVWPFAARAQQSDGARRLGVIVNFAADDPETHSRLTALLNELQSLGWTNGRNIHIDIRSSASEAERIRNYAAELVALRPDVILAVGSPATRALLQASHAVAIVFVQVVDPVGSGFVESLAHPGGSATGFANFEFGMSGKWLELLREIAPRVARAGVLRDSGNVAEIGVFGVRL
jgi:putative tryptophan/tyrosine transport system substrate-binding protein